MKKQKTNFLFLMLLIPVFFIGCQKSELVDDSKTNNPETTGNGLLKSAIVYCGQPLVVQLVEWENTSVSYGTVTIGNDATQLYITYEAVPGCVIFETYLYVGAESGIPGVNIGNGTGHFNRLLFPYHSTHPNVQSYTYTLPLGNFENCFAVVANAIMILPDGSEISAFGKNTLTLSWGYYVNYCKQQCTPPPPLGGCETAYAYGNNYATCFLNIPGVTSNNWGWSNGPIGAGTYSWPIYAGAGQCNIGNGILVGTLNVNYTPPAATVTYSMLTGYVLNATHLYVGNQILPKKNGKYTTAPGQFPYKHGSLNGVRFDSFTINGLSGNIYVVAHSEACDDI